MPTTKYARTISESVLNEAYNTMKVRIATLALLVVSIACAPEEAPKAIEPATATVVDTTGAWGDISAAFIEATFEIDPVFAVYQGRHEYDGKLPDLSADGIAEQINYLRAWQEQARAVNAAGLAPRDAFERDLLLWYCDSRLFWLDTARWPFKNPEYYTRYFSPTVYITRKYAPPAARLVALTRWAAAVPAALLQMQANLTTPLPRAYIERGVGFFGGMAIYLERDVPPLFARVGTPEQRAAFTSANTAAVEAFRATQSWLEAQTPTAGDDFAMGEVLFTEMVHRTELVDQPLAEMEAWNRQDQARNRAALDAACNLIAPGLATNLCVKKVDADKPARGPVARGTRQLVELKRFVIDHDLVSVPSPEDALVAEAPPYERANLAYIDIPGRYESPKLPSIYYISPPDPSWTVAEQRAYLPSEANLMFVSSHEVWPGHFLQGLHSRAYAGPLGGLLVSYAFQEGWAHYGEEMMWESAFGKNDPKLHVGQLISALWRNVRFESAIGLHTHGMTLDQSEEMFRDQAFLDPGNARQQAARGAYDPGYLGYTLGKLQIRALREEWCASRGGKTCWKDFHDTLLSYGAPPVPLARKYMMMPD